MTVSTEVNKGGRPIKLDYGSPDAPAEIRLFIPARVKLSLAEYGKPIGVAPDFIERGLALTALLARTQPETEST